MWTFSNYPELREKFFKHFRTGISEFYDPEPSLIAGIIVIDIVKFDQWLHKEIGNYEDEGMSLCEAISEYYGDDAAMLIDELTLDFITPKDGNIGEQ